MGPAPTHPRVADKPSLRRHDHHEPIRLATASKNDAPGVRIRGDDDGRGLTLRGFSRFISRHPALIRANPSLRIPASTAPRSASITRRFAEADTDHDGRVSAQERADFMTRQTDSVPRLPTQA